LDKFNQQKAASIHCSRLFVFSSSVAQLAGNLQLSVANVAQEQQIPTRHLTNAFAYR
jgi:hypothetical protein